MIASLLQLFNTMKISKRLPLTIVLFGLVPSVLISGFFLYQDSKALQREGPLNLQRITDATSVDMEHLWLLWKIT